VGAAKIVIPLIIVGFLGIVFFNVWNWNNELRESGCPGHWHTTFDVYVDGKKAGFPKPPYSLSGSEGGKLPLKMHMHQADNGNILHYEPSTSEECQGVRETFRYLDITVNERSLVFEAGSNHGSVAPGTYEVTEDKELRFFRQYANTEETTIGGVTYDAFSSYRNWEEISMGRALDIRQLPNFSKILIVYGDATDEQIQAWQQAVPDPPM